MIQLTTAANLTNAINKARTVKPRVNVAKFGRYNVTNKQTGAQYLVTCERRDGKRFADCTCKGLASAGKSATTSPLPSASTSS